MKNTLRLLYLATSILATGSAFAAPQFRQDRIIVKFRDPAAEAGKPRPNGTSIRKFQSIGGTEVIQLAPGVTPAQALASYRGNPNVAYATGDRLYKRFALPNDPRVQAAEAWHFANTGAKSTVADADIDAPEAWDIRHDAESSIVAVLDGGVRYTHEDLFANMWRNPGEIPGNGIDDDSNGIVDDVFGANFVKNNGNPMDDDGHGTHVAGILGAVGDNGKGSAGVAWKVQIMAVKVLPEFGSGSTSDIIAGMEYAAQKGAHIINASLGLSGAMDPAMSDAIGALEQAGITLVVSAGNEDADNDFDPHCTTYPASDPHANVVSVAASSRSDRVAAFSNYGWKSVDIAAPGVEIVSSIADSDTAYDSYSGTSMSAPVVSGALALLRAQFPADTMAQRIARLYRSVDLLPEVSGKCLTGGRLNLQRALAGSAPMQPYNDDYFDSKYITGVEFYGSTVIDSATVEAGEPSLALDTKTAWWLWFADFSGEVAIEAQGLPGVVPRVTVFNDANAIEDLTVNSSGNGAATFTAQAFRYYYIRVGTTGNAGPVSFYGRYATLPRGYGDIAFLNVGVQGSGTASPLLGSSRHKRGKKLTITAKPAPGQVFLGWVDPSDETHEILSRSAKYTFTMPDECSFALDAIFIPNPFGEIEGTYNGIVSRIIPSQGVADAFITLKVNNTGAFTGSITFNGKTLPIRGKFSTRFTAEVSVILPGSSNPVPIALKVGEERRLSVSFTNIADYEGFAEPADRSPFGNPAPQAGRYTFRFTVPGATANQPFGIGFGLVSVFEDGAVRFVGKLPDGSVVTQGTSLLRNGEWPLFAAPHKGGGAIAGRVEFPRASGSPDLAGDLHWAKVANQKDATYPGGFDVTSELSGARYFALVPTAPILDGLANTTNNLVFIGDSYSHSTNFGFPFTQTASGAFSGPPGFKMGFDRRSGLFGGEFIDAAGGGKKLKFIGVAILKNNTAVGQFTLDRRTGYMFIDLP